MDKAFSNEKGRRREWKSAQVRAAATSGSRLGSPSSLPPTAKRILAAAHKLLLRGGFEALSIKAIAEEAGEQRSSISYHFGDKAGLIMMLTDSLLRELDVTVLPRLRGMPAGNERLHRYLELQRQIATDSKYWRTLFGLLPHVYHDRKLRTRFTEMIEGYYENSLRALGLESGERAQMEIVASLALAVLEGFALQYQLHPKDFDMDARFELWESLFTPLVLSLLEQANGEKMSLLGSSTSPSDLKA